MSQGKITPDGCRVRITRYPDKNGIKIKFGTKVQAPADTCQEPPKIPTPRKMRKNPKIHKMADMVLFPAIYQVGPLIPDFKKCSKFKIFLIQTSPLDG